MELNRYTKTSGQQYTQEDNMWFNIGIIMF